MRDSPDSAPLDAVDWSHYDFIDLGSFSGGSLRACTKMFAAMRGIGVDISAKNVQRSREAGFDAMQADAQSLDLTDVVRFVSALDFLEHLPDLATVEKVLASAARAATDFLYIKHPSFEGEHYLTSLGVTQYWHNWRGHTSHIRVCDYCEMFERLGLSSYTIQFGERITTTDHYSIIPAGLPIDQGRYDPTLHGPRPDITFDEPIWRVQHIFVQLRPFSNEEWRAIVEKSPLPNRSARASASCTTTA